MINKLCLALFLTACGVVSPLNLNLVSEGSIRHFPFAFDVNGKTLVCWSEHADAYIAGSVDACTVIGNNKPASRNKDFYLSGVVQTGDYLLGESYITYAGNGNTVITNGWLSSDQGVTWVPQPGVMTLPKPGKVRESGWGGYLFHRRLHIDPIDGAIVGTVYGNYADDPNWYSTLWVKSRDMGLTWSVISAVAAGPIGTEGYGEPVSAFCKGQIVVVTRTGLGPPMAITRSFDNGYTWEAPHSLDLIGWDPDLLAVNDTLILSYGLPGEVHIAESRDCGRNWNVVKSLDLPTSSGYTGLSYDGKLSVFTDYLSETKIIGNVTWQ